MGTKIWIAASPSSGLSKKKQQNGRQWNLTLQTLKHKHDTRHRPAFERKAAQDRCRPPGTPLSAPPPAAPPPSACQPPSPACVAVGARLSFKARPTPPACLGTGAPKPDCPGTPGIPRPLPPPPPGLSISVWLVPELELPSPARPGLPGPSLVCRPPDAPKHQSATWAFSFHPL